LDADRQSRRQISRQGQGDLLAALLVLWKASASSANAAQWGAGLVHAVIGALFVYMLTAARRSVR